MPTPGSTLLLPASPPAASQRRGERRRRRRQRRRGGGWGRGRRACRGEPTQTQTQRRAPRRSSPCEESNAGGAVAKPQPRLEGAKPRQWHIPTRPLSSGPCWKRALLARDLHLHSAASHSPHAPVKSCHRTLSFLSLLHTI